jgi:hypothetical protein
MLELDEATVRVLVDALGKAIDRLSEVRAELSTQ